MYVSMIMRFIQNKLSFNFSKRLGLSKHGFLFRIDDLSDVTIYTDFLTIALFFLFKQRQKFI